MGTGFLMGVNIFHGYGFEIAKPDGFVPVAISTWRYIVENKPIAIENNIFLVAYNYFFVVFVIESLQSSCCEGSGEVGTKVGVEVAILFHSLTTLMQIGCV
jgi:hypothetical protein